MGSLSRHARRLVRVLAFGLTLAGGCRIARAESLDYSVVTTTSDAVINDDFVSLREALLYAQTRGDLSPENRTFRISFADSLFSAGQRDVTVSLGSAPVTLSNGVSVTVCGRTDARRVKLEATPSNNSFLYVKPGASLELRDLTVDFKAPSNSGMFLQAEGDFRLIGCRFNGTHSIYNGYAVKSTGSGGRYGVIDQCSFVGARAGVFHLDGSHRYDIATSTFADVDVSNLGSVLWFAGSGASSVVNCTFTGCKSRSGVAVLQTGSTGSGSVRVGNTVVVASSGTAVKATSANDSFDAVFCNSRSIDKASWTDGSWSVSEKAVFSGEVEDRWVGGVKRAFRPLKTSGGSVYGKGKPIARISGGVPNADILGRPVVGTPSPGSWATQTDADLLKRGDFVVTSASAGDTDDTDGVVSFRDAVRYAQTHPDQRDDDGNCRISFSPEIFPYGGKLRLKFDQRQLDIVDFANGCRLEIVGPSDGSKSVTLDGVGRYRLVQVGAGNQVSFSNLTFANGLGSAVGAAGTGAGGGVGNAGVAVFRNCAFVGCSAGSATTPSGWADGGGLATLPGGTSVVVRCSFSGCKAARGGGLATQDGGVSRVLCSTFYGNEACGDGTVSGGFGGGVSSVGVSAETVLAQVTLAGNRASVAGGGFASLGAAGTARLANVVAVGNTASDPAVDDLRLDRGYAMEGVRYGRGFIEGPGCFAGADNRSGCSVGATFADVRNGMSEPVSTDFASYGVTHALCRIATEIVRDAVTVWVDDELENIGCGTNGVASARLLCGTAAGLAAAAAVTRDEVDEELLDGLPFLGATCYSGAAAAGSSDPKYGPLVVTSGTRAALADAIAKAKADLTLAKDGSLTVSFAPDVGEIAFDEAIAIGNGAFAGVPLRIVGPVTFRCAGGASCRFLTVGGSNRVALNGVTCVGGCGEEIGGAVYVCGASSIEATDCTFVDNAPSEADYTYGGAVALEGGATGVFRQCAFVGNAADEGPAIYRDGTALALYGCTVNLPEGVGYGGLHARVDKMSGRKDWFDSLKTAIADCAAGDTLVILRDDIDTQAADDLPLGVTVVNEVTGAKSVAFLDSAVEKLTVKATANTAANDGTACYTVQSASDSVVCTPTAEATPVIGGADVDLTGSADAVLVAPSNVKVGLTYGLGHADSPAGPYVVDEWQLARPGEPLVLTAPKQGTSGYYRVIVR